VVRHTISTETQNQQLAQPAFGFQEPGISFLYSFHGGFGLQKEQKIVLKNIFGEL
jgi:hypothetical protein